MNVNHLERRRVARDLARIATIGCALMLMAGLWNVARSGANPVVAAPVGGVARVIQLMDGSPGAGGVLEEGRTETVFSLMLPNGAACKGDSANGNYKVQSYMVPASAEPASLRFDAAGPLVVGSEFRQPLFAVDTTPYVDAQTAAATEPGGPGPVVNVPGFDLKVFRPSLRVPTGRYNIGIACTLGPASETQLDRYWNAQVDVEPDPDDAPNGVRWTVVASDDGSTTVSSPPTSDDDTTSSTDDTTSSTEDTTSSTDDTTSSTDDTTSSTEDTTSSTDGDLPPSSDDGLAGGDQIVGGGPSAGSIADPLGALPRTGTSLTSLMVWAALLVVFGRMAYLLGQPPRVRPGR